MTLLYELTDNIVNGVNFLYLTQIINGVLFQLLVCGPDAKTIFNTFNGSDNNFIPVPKFQPLHRFQSMFRSKWFLKPLVLASGLFSFTYPYQKWASLIKRLTILQRLPQFLYKYAFKKSWKWNTIDYRYTLIDLSQATLLSGRMFVLI